MIDNNITSTVDDQVKHLYKLLNYINYRTFIILLFSWTLVDEDILRSYIIYF